MTLLDTTQRALHHRLATAQVEGRAPSMVGAVVRGGAQVWSQAIESDADTQFRIGSITKTFVAVLVMRLRDEGRLALGDRVDRHLDGAGAIGGATIAQLLSHTAGLAAETPGPWWERTPGALRPTLADALGDDPLKHPPGDRFHYSNPGYATLGALVERLRQKPWGEVVASEILDPLEMARTSVEPRAPHAEGRAVHPWADLVEREVVQDVGLMGPAGQLWSTAADLGRFAAVLAGRAADVLSADTASEMRAPRSAPEPDTWEKSYGLGVQTLRAGGRMLAGHTGSMPGFVAALWVCAAEDVSAAVTANATSGVQIGSLAAELVAIVADREPRIPDPWRPMPDADPALLELVGPWYWGPSGFALRLRAGPQLELAPLADGGRGGRFRPTDGGAWIGLDGYFCGETLRPARDAEGRLTHLDLGSFVFTRAPYDPDAPIPGGVDPDGWTGG